VVGGDFLEKCFCVSWWVITIQLYELAAKLASFSDRRLFALNEKGHEVSRNRLLLQRAIEEAEGYLELGMGEHSLRALQRRGKLVDGNGRACLVMGEALRVLECYHEALFALERSALLIPDDIHVWLKLGWCYKRTGQLAKAISALERAVQIDPAEGMLHYNLACYWSLARNRTLALRYLAHALEIDGNFRDMVRDEPDFNPLRNDPQFRQLTDIMV
jgi:tetratricopeptide (TPR) repeat protein